MEEDRVNAFLSYQSDDLDYVWPDELFFVG